MGSRAAVAVLWITGIAAAGADSFDRIGRALVPPLHSIGLAPSAKLNIWITPPAYTGVPPVVINIDGGDDVNTGAAGQNPTYLKVPAGSTVLAQMSGGGDVPERSKRT